MDVSRQWIRAEAERQGIILTDEDVEAVAKQLETTKAGLAKARRPETAGLEPSYRFVLPIPSKERKEREEAP